MATTEGGDVFAGQWMDRPLVEQWPDRYVEVIIPARRWLEWVVRRGPEANAARAGAVLLAAGGVPASSRAALAERFPPRSPGER